MSKGTPYVLKPDIAAIVEVEPVAFDFGPLISSNYQSGIYVTSADITVSVVAGADATPNDRLVAGPLIVNSQDVPAQVNAEVVAWFGTMVAGCTYLLQCVAHLSDGVSRPSMELRWSCYDPLD